MPEQVFKAPGYYDREVDASVRVVEPTGTPATIIGASLKGPAFVPSTVGAYLDFEAKFGTLDTKYAAGYAVEKFLASQRAATFIRVLGAGANSTADDISATSTKGIVKNAGFQVTGTAVGGPGDGRHKGSVQFLVAKHKVTTNEAVGFPMLTDNSSFTLASSNAYLVRAVLFTTSDARIMLLDTSETFNGLVDDVATVDDTSTNQTYRKFKLVVSSSVGSSFASDDGNAGIRIFTASLNPTDESYIGKILNTDPERFETAKHLLYADFAVDNEVAAPASGSGNANSVAIVSGSANTSTTSGDTAMLFRDAFGRFDTRFSTPRTPWLISQPFGFVEHNLFYLEAIDDGDYANNRYKVSIINLKASTDPRNDFGTFAVVLRDFKDTDAEPRVLEQFNNLTLSPTSENYVAKVIGDKKLSFFFDAEDSSDRKLKLVGKFANKSKLVRVVMSADVDQGGIVPQKALPFGFRGLEVVATNPLLTDQAPVSTSGRVVVSGSSDARITGSIVPPLPFRFKVTRGDVSAGAAYTGAPGTSEVVDTRYYWGIKFERNLNVLNTNVSNEPNAVVTAYSKFQGIKKLDTIVTGAFTDTFNSNKFTLARVALSNQTLTTVTAAAGTHMLEAAYIRNGSPDPTNYFITDGAYGNRVTLATVLNRASGSEFNRFSDYAKFTTMLAGGSNGVNILDKNVTRFGDKATSTETGGAASTGYSSPGATSGVNYSGTGTDNNAVASYKTAIDIATDELVSQGNLLVIPGQREPLVANYAMQKNEEFGLSFYLMDIPSYDANGLRVFDGETSKFVDVDQTARTFDGRALDSNAAAAYFPSIIIDDPVNNRRVTVPASVAGLAAFGYNDKVAYPWYAPAGFNRGALSFVVLPSTRVTHQNRSTLYDARINPVVKFPGQGYVFFTQRTLQQAKSLLESINIKRMVLEVKKVVTDIGTRTLWEQITTSVRAKFVADVSLRLSAIQNFQGIEQFKVVCDDSNNSTQDRGNNRMNGRVVMIPTTAVEFIQMDFVVTPSGVTFV